MTTDGGAALARRPAAPGGQERVLYAQCWEDADVLLAALDVQPGDACLSVASGGDNTLALLLRDPGRVVAVDAEASQLACLELRVAAYRQLADDELLELIGSRPSRRRGELYARCRAGLTPAVRQFWDRRRSALVARGLGGVGRFEGYFRLFRRFVLPLIHSGALVRELLAPKSAAERQRFFTERWDTWRWRAMVRAFFSRRVMGMLGREPGFFAHAHGSVAAHVLERARHGLVDLEPAVNPYLHWILTGRHGAVLPVALRPGHVARIRANLDRLEWHQGTVQDYAVRAAARGERFHRFNLSDVFEYMGEDEYEAALADLLASAAPGARLVYWNMMVARSRPQWLGSRLQPLEVLAEALHQQDQAFFYAALRIEAVP